MRIILAAAIACLATAASADDEFVKGIWGPSEEFCAKAKSDGVAEAIGDSGSTILTSRGIEGIEYNCEFANIKRVKLAPGWIVTAFCQEPGYAFPDVLTITEMTDTQVDIVSVKTAAGDEPSGNNGSYYFCEGAKEQ